MSEDKTYILKPKVKFTNGVNVKGYNKQFEIDGKQGTITLEAFNELFVEFSVDATRKQLRDALEPEICYWQDTSDDTTEYWGEELLDSVVEKALTVLGLLGGTTNE